MKAGRELDALIAEKVMGVDTSLAFAANPHYTLPHYSTQIADAWLVVEKFEKDNWSFGIETTNKFIYSELVDMWECYFCDDDASYETDASTAPLAICLAALKAVA